MVPQRKDSGSIHESLLCKIRSTDCFEADLNDRLVLKSVLTNFRSGSGLKLSRYGYEMCTDYKLYEFYAVNIDFQKSNSSLFATSLDRICKSPYYIKGLVCYISDLEIFTLLTLYEENFDFLFENFS